MTFPHLVHYAAEAFGSSAKDVLSRRRDNPTVQARFAVMEALRRLGHSREEIRKLVNRDSVETVRHGLEVFQALHHTDREFRRCWDSMLRNVGDLTI